MGLAGGPHCLAMCGAACAALGKESGLPALGKPEVVAIVLNPGGKTTPIWPNAAQWQFQLGRMLGYAGLGALAGASLQSLGWLTTQSAALRPVWSLFHVLCVVLGLTLMWRAQQPVWLEGLGRGIWRVAKGLTRGHGHTAALFMGMLWALLPCGLLYSALLLATLTSRAWDGAVVMALFALGSSVSLLVGPWLWLRLQARPGADGWGMRLAGLALAASSGWALWMGLVHNTAPWCVAT